MADRPQPTDRMTVARGATHGHGAGHMRAKAAKDKAHGNPHKAAPERPERVKEKRKG